MKKIFGIIFQFIVTVQSLKKTWNRKNNSAWKHDRKKNHLDNFVPCIVICVLHIMDI